VRALVRTPAKAAALRDLGCELVEGDLSDEDALRAAIKGCDTVIHGAAVYEIGVSDARAEDLEDANVRGTERVLGAALAVGVTKAVYVSTVAVFGNTRGEVADEQWTRPAGLAFTSVYERTKAQAHARAQELYARGLPLVTVQPGTVYGPGDTSDLGDVLDKLLTGKLPLLPFPELGVTPVHRDDVAAGILLALDKGVTGESYVLAGEPLRMRDADRRGEGPRAVRPRRRSAARLPRQPARGPQLLRRRHLLGPQRQGAGGARLDLPPPPRGPRHPVPVVRHLWRGAGPTYRAQIRAGRALGPPRGRPWRDARAPSRRPARPPTRGCG
jgi:nucleoside-diphosphate-sugar epimerase